MYGDGPHHDFLEEEFLRRGGEALEAALAKCVSSRPIETLLKGGRFLAHHPALLHECVTEFLTWHPDNCEFALDLRAGEAPAQVRVNRATDEVIVIVTARVGSVGAERAIAAVPLWARSGLVHVIPGDESDQVIACAVVNYAPGEEVAAVVRAADLVQQYIGELLATAVLEGVLAATSQAEMSTHFSDSPEKS